MIVLDYLAPALALVALLVIWFCVRKINHPTYQENKDLVNNIFLIVIAFVLVNGIIVPLLTGCSFVSEGSRYKKFIGEVTCRQPGILSNSLDYVIVKGGLYGGYAVLILYILYARFVQGKK